MEHTFLLVRNNSVLSLQKDAPGPEAFRPRTKFGPFIRILFWAVAMHDGREVIVAKLRNS